MDSTPSLVIIEDHEPDFILYSHVIKDAGKKLELIWISNGQEAVDFFQDAVRTQQAMPSLILLDLNLPSYSGHELLRFFKKDPGLQGIPIVILSSSGLGGEESQVLSQGAEAFIQKPLELDKLSEELNRVIDHWIPN